MNKLLHFFARFLSYVLHPVFMPTYVVVILLNSNAFSIFKINLKLLYLVYAVVFLNTCILPLLMAVLMKRFGFISSIKMEEQHERSKPYLITAILFLSTYYLLAQAHLPEALSLIMLGAALAVFLAGIINYRFKISAHLIGIGGLSGAFFALNFYFFIDFRFLIMVSLLIAGLIGWSRLYLNAHKPSQVYAGFAIGVACQLLVFLFY